MIVSASARPDSVSSRGSSLHRKRRSAYTQQAHAAAQGAFRSHAGPAVRPRVAHRGHTQLRGCLKRSHKATRGRRGGIGARGGINYYGAKSPRSARIFMPKRTSSAMSSSTMGGLPSSPPVHWPSSGSASISSMLLRGRNAKEQLKGAARHRRGRAETGTEARARDRVGDTHIFRMSNESLSAPSPSAAAPARSAGHVVESRREAGNGVGRKAPDPAHRKPWPPGRAGRICSGTGTYAERSAGRHSTAAHHTARAEML